MNQKVVFVTNHVAFFVSHRLPLAIEARRRGYHVELVTGQAGSVIMERAAVQRLADAGIHHTRVAFTPSGANPLIEFRGLMQLAAHMRKARPNLVHCASPKGLLYGGIAAQLAGVPSLVLAVSGLGSALTKSEKQDVKRCLLSTAYRLLARLAYRHDNKRVIVQNQDDLQHIVASGLAKADEVVLIPGSGVDVSQFIESSIDNKEPIVLFPARMLVEKGALDFIETARIVRLVENKWRFVMAGAADYDNPSAVSRQQLEAYRAEGIVEWLGHVDDMQPLYERASIVCLPSYYREGLPKALLEAAAAGCAVVTTDSPGCREAVVPGITGELVPPKQPRLLAETLIKLIRNDSVRRAYGRAGRERAAQLFSLESVVERVMVLYDELNDASAKNDAERVHP